MLECMGSSKRMLPRGFRFVRRSPSVSGTMGRDRAWKLIASRFNMAIVWTSIATLKFHVFLTRASSFPRFFLFWVPHSETFLYRRCFTYFFYYVINMSIIPVISFNLNLPFPGQAWNQLGLKFQLWLNNHLSEDVFFFPFPYFLLKKKTFGTEVLHTCRFQASWWDGIIIS